MGCVIGYDIPKEKKVIECPKCHGTGCIYQLFNIYERTTIDCTEKEYWLAPETEDDAYDCGMTYCQMPLEICDVCNTEGKIEVEY